MIHICGPKDPRRSDVINTTSRSKTWSRGLSPFFLGPVPTCAGLFSKNMENAWQYAKVYDNHVGEDGNPTREYFAWARAGWNNPRAVRYPMGRGAVPSYSYWNGSKLSYIEARKEIYIPLYSQSVSKTEAYAQLQKEHEKGDIWLWDFDGYDYHSLGMSLEEVLECSDRKMGHAFVLAMMLEGMLD